MSGAMMEHAAYLHDAGYHVLALDFRGSGGSGGKVTFGARERQDALAALDYLERRGDIDITRVGLHGMSMGAVVAVMVAAEDRRVAGVVAEAPFSSFPDLVRKSYQHKPGPLRAAQTAATLWALSARIGTTVWNVSAVQAAPRLTGRPLLIIENEKDAIVPAGSAEAIMAAAGEPKSLWHVAGSAHGDGHAVQPAEYERRVLEFWRTAFGGT
jgi:dipeptidyl aminopeptidase/acylaminoacyl peptidase